MRSWFGCELTCRGIALCENRNPGCSYPSSRSTLGRQMGRRGTRTHVCMYVSTCKATRYYYHLREAAVNPGHRAFWRLTTFHVFCPPVLVLVSHGAPICDGPCLTCSCDRLGTKSVLLLTALKVLFKLNPVCHQQKAE